MATRNAEQSPVSKGIPPPPPLPLPSPVEQLRSRVCNTVFKTGPLFISSKGIGWTSWKKRWFILTRTSLVFFRSDPSAIPQKGSEVNLTLGGIDLNNSGSVIVKEDKKLLTVIFPDGREGRTFTLKAETLQELQEWKTALESALAQAPNNPTGQNASDDSPVKVSVVGRPVLLALEDADGTPSFLEKALQFIEEHGVKTEGILRQAADVDDVERRIHEYEEGKNEFSSGEDAHVIADCIKYILREMPSSPIPASCCKALLQACRTERNYRVNAMRTAICETFPEPNRRLLQRILTMMKKIVVHKAENRMSCSAAAACMAPLLLRPLLAGECEIDSDFDLGGDGSVQLIQAAAAANHAQAIVITLLDEYDKIFGEGSASPEPYTDAEESGSESGEETDEEGSYEDDENDDGSGPGTDDDPENASSLTCSGSGGSRDNSLCDNEGSDGSISGSDTSEVGNDNRLKKNLSSSSFETPSPEPVIHISKEACSKTSSGSKSIGHAHAVPVSIRKSTTISNGPVQSTRNRSTWGRTAGRKKLSMESIDYSVEEEAEIQSLEIAKSELENKIMEEVKENVILQSNLEIRKKDLQRRRQALEQEVAQLQERLQKERDRRAALEAGLNMSHEPLPNLDNVDEKTKVDLEEIAVAEADIVSLTQKLGELGKHLLHGAVPKPRSSPHKTRVNQTKLYRIDKQNDEAGSRSHFERNTNSNLGGTEIETESKVESTYLSNKNLPQIHKTGSLGTRSYRSTEVSGDSSTSKPSVSRRSSAKRSVSTKVEGTVSTNTALTKLTTRLNFLKERRNQMAHELQSTDIVRGSPRSGQNSEKSQGSEFETESQPPQNPEMRSQSLNYSDGSGKRSESHSSHGFDKGKSDNNVMVNIDKGRVVEGQPTVSSRTSNR